MIIRSLKHILGPLRLPFLALTPVCVLLGYETATLASGQINTFHFMLVMVGALSAHVSVNTFNEYFDFKSGVDLKTKRTPFSGGSGTLPSRPEFTAFVLAVAIITFFVTCFIGLYFVRILGPAILPIGITGIVVVLSYTTWVTRHPILCLIAPGLAFGPLMVVGTHLVLTGDYSPTAIIVSLVPFFLVNNLLLLNQYPDIDADRAAGRRTFPIVFGKQASNYVFFLFIVLAYLSLAVSVYFEYLPKTSLLGLGTLVIAVTVLVGLFKYSGTIKKLVPYLGLNVAIALLTPILMIIGAHV